MSLDRGSAGPSTRSSRPPTARVPFVFRLGAGIVPKRSTVFQDGDLLYIAVADARLAEVESILGGAPKGE